MEVHHNIHDIALAFRTLMLLFVAVDLSSTQSYKKIFKEKEKLEQSFLSCIANNRCTSIVNSNFSETESTFGPVDVFDRCRLGSCSIIAHTSGTYWKEANFTYAFRDSNNL